VNPSTLSDEDFYPLIEARHFDPFKFLGIREFQGSQFGRVFRPDALEVVVVDTADDNRRFPLTQIHPDGFFESVLRGAEQPFDYILEMKSHLGDTWQERDAYSYGPVLGEMDIYLFNEGTHYEVYRKLGAHMMELGGVKGTHFAVWAPNAQRVSVVGDFNHLTAASTRCAKWFLQAFGKSSFHMSERARTISLRFAVHIAMSC
jgi:1,4-alpha-glucan branching enzyme